MPVVDEAGHLAEFVDAGLHPVAVVDQVAAGVAGAGGRGGDPQARLRVDRVVGEGQGHVSLGAPLADAAVPVVVRVVVPAVVGIGPGGDPAAFVVGEAQR